MVGLGRASLGAQELGHIWTNLDRPMDTVGWMTDRMLTHGRSRRLTQGVNQVENEVRKKGNAGVQTSSNKLERSTSDVSTNVNECPQRFISLRPCDAHIIPHLNCGSL